MKMENIKNLKKMTNEELRELNEYISEILEERRSKEKEKAIENFRKAFEELQKYMWSIEVEDSEYEIRISDFNQFIFEG